MAIYKLIYENTAEYIEMEMTEELYKLGLFAENCELQYFNRKPIVCKWHKNSGIELPDVMIQEGMIFFSDKLKRILENENIYYIYYKQIKLEGLPQSRSAIYWLAVIPKVDCLNIDELEIADNLWDMRDGLFPVLYDINVQGKDILIDKLGHYELFRIVGVVGSEYYVTDDIYDILSREELEGIVFKEI